MVWDGYVHLTTTMTPLNEITRLSNLTLIFYETFFARHPLIIRNLWLQQPDEEILIFDTDVKGFFIRSRST